MFSAPLWLSALATLLIPLALHLWSRRPRQVIRVGSLRHITDLTEARSWSARLTEPLLLLLRLGILASIVFALAGPRLANGRLSGAVSHLILVEPALLEDSTLVGGDPLLDSLARSRVTVRLLEPGLPRLQLDGERPPFPVPYGRPDGSPVRDGERGTLWDLLVSADRLVSQNGEMLVIARPRVATLGGRRPALRARVIWHVPQSGGKSSWAAARWRTAQDTLITLTGMGDVRRVRYQSLLSPAAGTLNDCAGCAEVRPVALWVSSGDSGSARRLRLAAMAVGGMLGQAVEPAGSAQSADLILTTAELSDSMLRLDRPVASISPAIVGSIALADTVLAYWPWHPLAGDAGDPREISLAQALPRGSSKEAPDQRDARVPLLLLALILFTIERWLSTRPVARSA